MSKNVKYVYPNEAPERAAIKLLTPDKRAKEIGATILRYEAALEEAFEQIDKLDALGVESAPWTRHTIESGDTSEYGSYLSPGPRLRLEVR